MTQTVEYVTPACPACGKTSRFELDKQALASWRKNILIQDAFPDLPVADRETVKTGWHGPCWDSYFGEEK